MKSVLPIWLGIMLLATSGYGAFWLWRNYDNAGNSGSYSPPMKKTATGDFTLTDQNGQPFNSGELKGEVWVASFFFVSCPSICFQLNQRLAELRDEFADDGVHFVSITVDPKNDTPEVLKKYAERFQAEAPQWRFLTGEMTDIKRIGMNIFKLPTDELTHTDRVAIIDRQGRLSGVFKALDEHQYGLLKKALAAAVAEESSTEDGSTGAPMVSAAPSGEGS